MSNKTQLQANNTALDALITRVNTAKDTVASLPEASGGGSGGSATVTVTINGYFEGTISYAGYFDSTGAFKHVTSASTVEALGGIIITYNSVNGSSATGSYTQGKVGYALQYCFLLDGGTITLYGPGD
jgi:hypothetical protein